MVRFIPLADVGEIPDCSLCTEHRWGRCRAVRGEGCQPVRALIDRVIYVNIIYIYIYTIYAIYAMSGAEKEG